MFNYKLIATALLTIGSVVGVREYLKPRDIENLLKWKGINLISENENNAWEASFYENSEALKAMQIDSHEKLKNWCLAQMKQGITDELAKRAEKYCQDKPFTIIGHIIRDGEKDKFVRESDTEATQIIYVTSKDRNQLKKVMSIKISENLESEEEVFSKISKEVSKWCNNQKTSKAEGEIHLANVKKYCYDKKVKKVQELLKKQGFELLEKEEKYKENFNKQELNRVPELINEIKEILKKNQKEESEFINEEKVKAEKQGEALKLWCDSNKDKELTKAKTFSEVYPRVQSRCTFKRD